MQNTNKKLFEETPVPQAVQTMMIPTIIGALVTVLYSLATFLSNCFACCYFFVLLIVRKKKTNINLNPKYLSLTKEMVFGVMEVGIPAAIQNLLNVTGMTILNNFVAGYGSYYDFMLDFCTIPDQTIYEK